MAWLPRLVWVFGLAFGCLSSEAHASSDLLKAAVGQQTQPLSVTLTLTGNGTAAAPQALTQGVAGLDFSVASGGTCAANAAYLAGQQCTVNVIFAPKYPGLRLGAVVLLSTDGRVIGSAPLAGDAEGPLSVLNPGRIDTVAGDGELNFRTDGVAATQAPIFLPYGVLVDPAGNIFLSDSNNNRIRRVDVQTGLISTIAGTGTAGYSGDGGPAYQASVSQPGGLGMDGAGNIYFADSGNEVIRRIDAQTGIISTVAGVPLAQGYSGDGLKATSADLSSPRGIALDAAGDLYIADTGNNAIRKVDGTSGIITTVAGTGAAGYNGDGILATSAQLYSPWTVSVGQDGSVYIADLSNNRIRKVTAGVISTEVGTGVRGFSGDTGPASAAELNDPTSVILDPAGDLLIADSGNNRIRKVYAATGVIQTLTGNDSTQFGGDAGPANEASLYAPYALFLDQSGDLYLSDTLHNRIRRILASPIALTYPVMRVGKVSAPQIEGLENDGNASLSLSTPVLNDAALDSTTTTCSFTSPLAASAGCNLGVEFAPTSVGTNILGSATLDSNAGPSSPTVINLSGQVLSVEPTSVALVSSVNPSLAGQTVTFTATVTTADPSPTGPVTFLDGNTAVCNAVSLSAKTASCVVSTLALGQHSITASYAGDDNNAASVSPALSQNVKQKPTLTLAGSPNPVVVTQSLTLTLTATAPTGTPSGAVVFYDGTTALSGNVSLNSGGTASFSTTQLAPGQHSLTAQYAGDLTNASGTSNAVIETVSQTSTVTTVASSNSTVNAGVQVTFTATVISPNGPAPTATVQFTDGTTVLGSSNLDSGGHATLTTSALAPGTHHIVATYSGDTDNSGSSSAPMVEAIQQIPVMVALASDANPAGAGATIHLTATVALGAGALPDGAIAGTITFSKGAQVLGSAVLNASGAVSIALSTLPVGAQSITASYPGSTNYVAATSAPLVETINSTSSTTALTSGAATVLAGKPATFTATVASPTGIPTGVVVFRNGATSIGQGTLNAAGVATFTTTALPVGADSLTAAYQGDGNYVASTSPQLVETVALATTSVTLSTAVNPVSVGASVSFTSVLTGNGLAPTGVLSLNDGNTSIATQNVTNTGTLTFSISTLALGGHTLTVTYAGDADNSPATSNSISLTVRQDSTSTSLSASANPSTLGQSLSLSASVASPGANLTGTVAFEDGTTVLGSVPLAANGIAVFSTSSLSFGSHSLTAVYSGDTNHTASTSLALTEQIVQGAVAALSSSVNPSVAGAPTVFTVNLSGVGSLIPTGSVSFSDGANPLATVQVNGSGSASFQTSALAVGSHTITAAYSGDRNYQTATATLVQTVQSASTQVVVAASANPATYGAAITLTSTVSSNGGVATGTVSFTSGGQAIGSAVLNSSGVATLTTSSLVPGAHSIVANYAGSGSASASASTPLTLNVFQPTSISLASNANPSPTLSSIVLTATLTNSGATALTGMVTFTDGATQIGTAAVATNGSATLTLPSLTAGTHHVVATYAGDNNDFPSASSAMPETVQLRPTTTALTSSYTNPSNSQQATLIGIVRWTGATAPTGTITFTQGSTVLGTSAIDQSGAATIDVQISPNAAGFVATYNGDSSYAGSASLTTAVASGPASQFSLTLTPPNLNIQTTQHTVVDLAVASVNNFSDTLQFGCLGLPFAATCTFSSPQSNLPANGASSVQLTVDTGDPLGAGAVARNAPSARPTTLLCFLPVGALAALVLFGRRSFPGYRSLPALLLLLCGLAVTLSVTGCAGLTINGTPPGTYTFKVTASGLVTGATESQTVTLTVSQ